MVLKEFICFISAHSLATIPTKLGQCWVNTEAFFQQIARSSWTSGSGTVNVYYTYCRAVDENKLAPWLPVVALVGYRSTDILLAELYYINKSSYDLYVFKATTQWHVTQFGSHFSVGMWRSWEFFEPQKSLLNATVLLFILSSVSGAAHTAFRQPSQPKREDDIQERSTS